MFICPVIENPYVSSYCDEDGNDDIRYDAIKQNELVNAVKEAQSTKGSTGHASIHFFADWKHLPRSELSGLKVKIKDRASDNQKY